MKQYLLSVCYPAGGTQPPPDALQQIMRDVARGPEGNAGRRRVDIQRRASLRRIPPPCCATRAARSITTDGPFIESKEQIGGITILKAPDLDAALDWGRKLARAIGTPIEVRPFVEGH